ncbi:MAG: 16S rRNA (cytidine(1402)-2'-O)-methyltransferase [Acidibacillus sp.]|uniref:Ribosomal RNA small subunit methyltransferase I n=1 Tax=Sulfoacidibacillus ferrooxidans TaxID=2005001 RepID=A0A9X2ACS6_9BACL|nr:16S rRNA (cytidine(1402)-2'-O)-methyltransferase [Sulfoacidibacillus ferrooxidans]MCI0182635.1 Ribosomal RNA small subunit methyltransferase I [Sulfoacidibacillus ferrooxidans]MCY0894093.1 16S rRNA (cytidine(1402)-2'-O)-methyltransferase [Acidibacillus sp.]
MSKEQAVLPGTLYVVPTPIGNLEDMTFRALRILQEVDFIAAEDTRHSRKLLTHFDIHPKRLFSYHEHNIRTSGDTVIDLLQSGLSGALISDAGMPAVSDPGYDLIAQLIEADLPFVVLPGPSAVITALVGSGLSTGRFSFHGFLPRDHKDRLEIILKLRGRTETFIFYEAPHRIDKLLADLYEGLGDCPVVIAKELTKRNERYVRGRLSEYEHLLPQEIKRGEMVVLVEADPQWSHQVPLNDEFIDKKLSLTIPDHVEELVAKGMTRKEAMREVAKARSISRRDVYQILLNHK